MGTGSKVKISRTFRASTNKNHKGWRIGIYSVNKVQD